MEAKHEGRISPVYIMVGILLLVLLAYYPVFGSYFVNYDDPSYVTSNNHVKSGITADSIKWAFTTFYFYNWHPLTWISHMLDVQLFGMDPMWHHLTNLLLHIINSLLLFILFEKMTGATWKSLCIAGLFALHPFHVESVAWVADRKDVLSTFFWFLTMLAYVDYARKPKGVTYVLCALFFALGLMAKPMLVTLPVVLLLMDSWPLDRVRQRLPDADGTTAVSSKMSLAHLVLEKVPLALMSLASVIVTYLAQKKGGALRADSSMIVNAGHAFISYVKYAAKMAWPGKLAVYYPYEPAGDQPWQMVMAMAGIILVSILVIRAAKRLPSVAVGWFWYVITLVPVIGILRIGDHAMADRYTYVPLIGLFLLVIWGTSDLAKWFHIPGRALTVLMIAIITVCSVLTNLQARRWHDSITLFTYTLEVTENNSLAHKNLAAALAQQGNLVEALHHASESLRIHPEPLEYVSQAWLLIQLGHYEKAAGACRTSIRMAPDNEKAHFLLGVFHIHLGNYDAAAGEYRFLKRSGSSYAYQLLDPMSKTGIALPAD